MNRVTKVAFIDKKIKDAFEKLKNGKTEGRELYKFLKRAIGNIISPMLGGSCTL